MSPCRALSASVAFFKGQGMNSQSPLVGYLDNAVQLEAASGLFIGTFQLLAVLLAGWAAIAYLRSRRDP